MENQEFLIDTLTNNGIMLQNAVNEYAKKASDAIGEMASVHQLVYELSSQMAELSKLFISLTNTHRAVVMQNKRLQASLIRETKRAKKAVGKRR